MAEALQQNTSSLGIGGEPFHDLVQVYVARAADVDHGPLVLRNVIEVEGLNHVVVRHVWLSVNFVPQHKQWYFGQLGVL